jgi:hypothetical protein
MSRVKEPIINAQFNYVKPRLDFRAYFSRFHTSRQYH